MTLPAAPLSLYGYGLLIVASIILLGVSIGTPHWLQVDDDTEGTIAYGLFKSCVQDKCKAYTGASTNNFLDITKGLVISGCVTYALTLGVIGHLVLGQKMLVQSKNHGYTCLVFCIIGAVLTWSGTGHFMNKIDYNLVMQINKDQWNYGYSLYLASFSGFLCTVAGIFAVLAVGALFRSQILPGLVFQSSPPQPGVQVITSNVNNSNMNPGYAAPPPQYNFPVSQTPQGYGQAGHFGAQPPYYAKQ